MRCGTGSLIFPKCKNMLYTSKYKPCFGWIPLPTNKELYFFFNNIFRQLVHYDDAALHDFGGSGGWRKIEVGKVLHYF